MICFLRAPTRFEYLNECSLVAPSPWGFPRCRRYKRFCLSCPRHGARCSKQRGCSARFTYLGRWQPVAYLALWAESSLTRSKAQCRDPFEPTDEALLAWHARRTCGETDALLYKTKTKTKEKQTKRAYGYKHLLPVHSEQKKGRGNTWKNSRCDLHRRKKPNQTQTKTKNSRNQRKQAGNLDNGYKDLLMVSTVTNTCYQFIHSTIKNKWKLFKMKVGK